MPNQPDPFETMTDLRRRLYRVLEQQVPARAMAPTPYSPPLDISQTPGGTVITIELPGIEREAVDVALEGDLLTISGEGRSGPETGEVYRQERPHGRFSRSLSLSGGRDRQVAASLKQGVLTVVVGAGGGQ